MRWQRSTIRSLGRRSWKMGLSLAQGPLAAGARSWPGKAVFFGRCWAFLAALRGLRQWALHWGGTGAVKKVPLVHAEIEFGQE